MVNFGPPEFDVKPQEDSFESGITYTYSFSSITDPDGDAYVVEITGLPDFCTWIEDEMKFTCDTLDYEFTSYEDDYKIIVTLTDIRLDPSLQQYKYYSFFLRVRDSINVFGAPDEIRDWYEELTSEKEEEEKIVEVEEEKEPDFFAEVKEVTKEGILIISFSQPIQLTEDLQASKASDLLELQVTNDQNSRVSIINGYSVFKITETELWLQLDFKSQSALSEKNIGVEFRFYQTGNIYMQGSEKQISNAIVEVEEKLEKLKQESSNWNAFGIILGLWLLFFFCLQIAFSDLRLQFYSFLNMLQITTHFLLLNLALPESFLQFFNSILPFSNFWFFGRILQVSISPKNQPFTLNHDLAGYPSHAFLQTIHNWFFILIAIGLFSGVVKLINVLNDKIENQTQQMDDMITKLRSKVKFAAIIRGTKLFYIDFFMGCLMNFYFFDFSTGGEAISALFSVLLIGPLFLLPLLIGVFLYRNSQILSRIDIKNKYGSIYEGLDLENSKAKYLIVLQYFRKWVLVFSIIFLKKHYLGQFISILIASQVCFFFVLNEKPYKDQSVNKMELLNEGWILLVLVWTLAFKTTVDLTYSEVYAQVIVISFMIYLILFMGYISYKGIKQMKKGVSFNFSAAFNIEKTEKVKIGIQRDEEDPDGDETMRPLDKTVNDSVIQVKKLEEENQTGSVLPQLFPKKAKIGFIEMQPINDQEEEKKDELIVQEVDQGVNNQSGLGHIEEHSNEHSSARSSDSDPLGFRAPSSANKRKMLRKEAQKTMIIEPVQTLKPKDEGPKTTKNAAFEQMFFKQPTQPLIIQTASPFVALKQNKEEEERKRKEEEEEFRKKKAQEVEERRRKELEEQRRKEDERIKKDKETLDELEEVEELTVKQKPAEMDLDDIAGIKKAGWEVDQQDLDRKAKTEKEKLKQEMVLKKQEKSQALEWASSQEKQEEKKKELPSISLAPIGSNKPAMKWDFNEIKEQQMAKIEQEIVEDDDDETLKREEVKQVSEETDEDMFYELPQKKKKQRAEIDESKIEQVQLPDIYSAQKNKKDVVKEVASIDFD